MIVKQPVTIDTVHISYLLGTIKFEVHEKEYIEIESEHKEKINTIITDHAFYIKGIPQKETKHGSKTILSTFFKPHDVDKKVPISDIAPSVSLIVKVPKNTIRKIEVTGRLHIHLQNISTEIELHSFGKNTFKLEKIMKINLTSTGEIEGKVLSSQELTVSSSGKTKFDVKSHEMDYVSFIVNGVNDIQIKSLIKQLNIDMIGNGKCLVKGTVHTKSISSSSLSDVILKE
jgi:hypothetical protein